MRRPRHAERRPASPDRTPSDLHKVRQLASYATDRPQLHRHRKANR